MNKNKAPRTTGRNLPLAEAMIGKRLSSAAGTHGDRRTKRVRTRGAATRRALKDW
jgi:hypothetical protein